MNMPDVIVIGAGVVGASIAYHLAKFGCRDVVVLDKGTIGGGATEKCAGGIRQQFSSEANVRLSLESVRFFERFEEETGHAADFRQHGYLILASSEDELTTLRHGVQVQRGLGLAVDLLDPSQVAEMVPGLSLDGVAGASFCATDGYADPYSVVSGFTSAAKRLGVKIHEGTEVIGMALRNGTVQGVVTDKGIVEAPIVVNAAGPYARHVAAMAGLDLPVSPKRRHMFITEPVFRRANPLGGLNRSDLPMVVEFHNGFWFRREGLCLIFGMRNPRQQEGFSIDVDWDFFTDTLADVACHRVPGLRDIGIARAQAGLHADTPDYMAILGEAPDVPGLYLACGFSGHGFMHSPATGRLMAELVLGMGTAASGVEPFRPDRFKDQTTPKESAFI